MRTLKLIILLILSTFKTINSTNIKISECGVSKRKKKCIKKNN